MELAFFFLVIYFLGASLAPSIHPLHPPGEEGAFEVRGVSLEGANTARLGGKRAVYPIFDLKKTHTG